MKSFLSLSVAFLLSALKVLFSPAELKRAFVASFGASTAIGFAVGFLGVLGTDAAATPSAGFLGALVSFVLLNLAGRLAKLQQAQAAVAPVHSAQGLISKQEAKVDVTPAHVEPYEIFYAFEEGLISKDIAIELLGRIPGRLDPWDMVRGFMLGIIDKSVALDRFTLFN